MIRRSLGVCSYPKHRPEALWPEDARRTAEAGLTWVRIGEFEWSRLEPDRATCGSTGSTARQIRF